MLRKIYRKEAIEYKKHHWKGKALLLAGLPAWLIALLSFAFLAILITTTIFCTFTQRIDVRGEVITLPHSVNVYAPQQGFVISQYAKVGDLVAKGQSLYEIDISRNTTTGNVSTAQIEVINEKIANAEDIITKLSHNKEETRLSLDKQLKTINDSLKETNRMLVNAQTGLKKMHDNLSSYDKYLRDGLITKDQYNYQHSLYFQQQSTYQSLVSQKMQLESQVTQLNSDKITKTADFDNQISSQENQINDYKNQLVESNANGNVIIKATTEGRIESLAVTKGQMVDKGSSLAQIKPTGDIEYYLILWLPKISYLMSNRVMSLTSAMMLSHPINLGNSRGKYFQYLRSRHPDRNCLNTLMLIMERTSRNWHSIKPLSKLKTKPLITMVKRFRFRMD